METTVHEVDFPLIVTDAYGQAPEGNFKQLPGKRIVCRADNMEPLAYVSDRYSPITHGQIIEAGMKALDRPPNRAFLSEKAGRTMTALWESPRPVEIIPGDTIKLSFSLRHSITGYNALVGEVSLFRYICSNGATAPLTDGQRFKHYHSGDFDPDDLVKEIADSFRQLERVVGIYDSWTGFEVNRHLEFSPERAIVNEVESRGLGGKRFCDRLLESAPLNRTLWETYNAVTAFTTHKIRSHERKRLFDLAAFDALCKFQNALSN